MEKGTEFGQNMSCLGVFTFCTCCILTCLGWFVAGFKLSSV